MTRTVRVRVSGEVQGVGFRVYAAREAVRLGLVGWVRNEPDDTVVAHLEGPDEAVAEMLDWCRRGSPAARVTDVEVDEAEPTGAGSFRVDH